MTHIERGVGEEGGVGASLQGVARAVGATAQPAVHELDGPRGGVGQGTGRLVLVSVGHVRRRVSHVIHRLVLLLLELFVQTCRQQLAPVRTLFRTLVGPLVRTLVWTLVRASVRTLVQIFVRTLIGTLVRTLISSLVRTLNWSLVRTLVGTLVLILVRTLVGSLVGTLVGSLVRTFVRLFA